MVAGAMATAATGAAALTPARADTVKSTVTISSRVPAFSGRVKSGVHDCVSKRRVQLFRRSSSTGGRRIGKDRSSSSGHWEIGVDPLQSGAYYAKAKREKAGGSVVCLAARSEIVVVD